MKIGFPILIIFLSIVVFLLVGSLELFLIPPSGIHFIRQTDCLSFVENYYLFDLPLLQPEIFNLNSIDGKAISEFPILYFIAAKVYSINGRADWILRLITFMISITGFVYLTLIFKQILKNTLVSIFLILIFLCSPVLHYYSINFLADVSALSFFIIGFYYFIQQSNSRFQPLYLAFFLTLSILLKASFAILATVLLIYSLYQLISKKEKPMITFVVATLIPLVAAFTYFFYSNQYNLANNNHYFLRGVRPFWESDPQLIMSSLRFFFGYWFNSYFAYAAWLFIVLVNGCGLYLWIKKGKLNGSALFNLLLIIASTIYFALFTSQFIDHDYYFLFFMFPIAFISAVSISTLLKEEFILRQRYLFPLAIVLLFVALVESKNSIEKRIGMPADLYSEIEHELSGIDGELENIGVEKDATFLVLGDHSPNGSLFFLKRKGYTFPGSHSDLNPPIEEIIGTVDYVLVLKQFKKMELLDELVLHQISTFNSTRLYELKD